MIPFKLSVISDEVSQDLEVVAKFANHYGLDGIEIRTVWNKPPQQLVGDLSQIKTILRDYGLEVPCIASPFYKANIDNISEIKEHLSILEKCILLATSLESNIIRVFTFWRKDTFWNFMDRILELYKEPIKMAEENDVFLAVENEPSTFATNAKKVSALLKKVNNPRLKAIWDPGNDLSDPDGENPYPEGYNYIKEYIIHVHLKDGIRKDLGKYEPTAIGKGEVDYLNQFKALLRDGYKGYLSLETHWRPEKKLSEEQLVTPGGSSFSERGKEASAICMENLLQILCSL